MVGFGLALGVPLALTVGYLVMALRAARRAASRPAGWQPRPLPAWVYPVLLVVVCVDIGWQVSDHDYANAIFPVLYGIWAVHQLVRRRRLAS